MTQKDKYNPIFKTCAVCGKLFILPSQEYVYKKYKGHGTNQRRVFFCGWTCMRQWEKEHEKKIKRGKNKNADYG